MLETQLKEVEAKIQAACDRAGRKREEVTLIAVSKIFICFLPPFFSL